MPVDDEVQAFEQRGIVTNTLAQQALQSVPIDGSRKLLARKGRPYSRVPQAIRFGPDTQRSG